MYGAALLVSSPILGWLADRIESRQWPLLMGLLALAGSTVMLCLGNSIALLAAGRALQGVSAAVVWVVSLALLVDTLGPQELGLAMGYVGLSLSLALLVAPLLGGVVFASSGYYSVFAMAFGLIILDVFLRVVMVEKKFAKRWLPEASEHSTTTEEADVTDAVAQDQRRPDSHVAPSHCPIDQTIKSPTTKLEDDSATMNPGCTESHQLQEPRKKRFVDRLPAVIYLFSSRRLLSGLWLSLIQASLLCAFDATLPLFVRDTFSWNSIGAGLVFLPLVIGSFAGPFIGWASDKYNAARWFASAGFLLSCPVIILLRLVDHDSLRQKILLCALLCVIGLGLTMALTPVLAEIAYAVDAKARNRRAGYFGKNGAYAQAYSLFNMAWAGGAMCGPLLGGLVNESRGWNTTTLILGCISAFTAIPAAIWTGGSLLKRRRRRAQESPAE